MGETTCRPRQLTASSSDALRCRSTSATPFAGGAAAGVLLLRATTYLETTRIPFNKRLKISGSFSSNPSQHDGLKHYGLIAEEVYAVSGAAVIVDTGSYTTGPDTGSSGPVYVGYERLTPILLKAVQDLRTEVKFLRASITGSTDLNQLKATVSGSTFV